MATGVKVECIFCGKIFTVSHKDSPMPRHPTIGEKSKPGVTYIKCPRSGQKGLFIDIVL